MYNINIIKFYIEILLHTVFLLGSRDKDAAIFLITQYKNVITKWGCDHFCDHFLQLQNIKKMALLCRFFRYRTKK